MSRNGPSFWDLHPAALDQAVAMRNQALSCGAIGRALGCTRNVIIGKLSRMNLPSLFLGAHTSDGRLNFHDRPVKIKPEPKRNGTRVAPIKLRNRAAALPFTKHGTLLTDLSANQCRFGIGYDKKRRHVFCGSATEGGSWCEVHKLRVFKNND